jgi:hypothetical protein
VKTLMVADRIREAFRGLGYTGRWTPTPRPGTDSIDLTIEFVDQTVRVCIDRVDLTAYGMGAVDAALRQAHRIRMDWLAHGGERGQQRAWERRAPDLTDYLIGYRCWKVDAGGGLQPFSAVGGGFWRTELVGDVVCLEDGWDGGEPVQARCLHHEHVAPSPACHCGWNTYRYPASFDPDFVRSVQLVPRGYGRSSVDPRVQDQYTVGWEIDEGFIDTTVAGAVRGWGRCEVHVDGWRSEWAQPVVLAANDLVETAEIVRKVRKLDRALEYLGPADRLPPADPAWWECYEEERRQVPCPSRHPAAYRVAMRYPELRWVRWDQLRAAAREYGQELGQQLLPEPESSTAGLSAMVRSSRAASDLDDSTGRVSWG